MLSHIVTLCIYIFHRKSQNGDPALSTRKGDFQQKLKVGPFTMGSQHPTGARNCVRKCIHISLTNQYLNMRPPNCPECLLQLSYNNHV